MDVRKPKTVVDVLRAQGCGLSEAWTVEEELSRLIELVCRCAKQPTPGDPESVIRAMRLRFGIGSGDSPPLADVAAACGVSKQRVHQLEQRFVARLAAAADSVATPLLDACAAHYRATPGKPYPRLGRCSQRRACELNARMRGARR